MSRLLRCFLPVLLAGIMAVSAAGCRNRNENASGDPKAVEKIVEEIAVDHGTYGAEAKERIGTLLKELSAIDGTAGKRWTKIVDLWTSPELGQPLHYDVLPDGLPDTDELCIVVLGFQLDPDGTMKEELIQRLTVALRSAEKYPKAYIVCTGGGTAAGSILRLSSSNKMSYLRNGSFYDIDQGVEPDFFISKLSNYYDRQSLAAYLNELK